MVGEVKCATWSQFSIDKTATVLFYYFFATLPHCWYNYDMSNTKLQEGNDEPIGTRTERSACPA